MPFIFVWGLPETTSKETLIELRRMLVMSLAENMRVEQSWVRVFFPADRLGELAEDENDHIYITIETGMFFSKPADSNDPKSATEIIAQKIWETFDGKYKVECFLGNHNPVWVSLIPAKG